MATPREQSDSPLDTPILLLAVLVMAGSIVGFYYFEPQYNALVRVVGLLVGAAISIALILQTEIGRVMWSYIQGSRTELRKVVWPTRQESIRVTFMILVVVMLIGLFLAAVDYLLLHLVQWLTGRG